MRNHTHSAAYPAIQRPLMHDSHHNPTQTLRASLLSTSRPVRVPSAS